jgi:hypothetical protein
MIRQSVKEKIIVKSISLEKFGLNDLAWNKEDAKNLIQLIKDDNIGILGGDVYKLKSNHLESLGDNWYCETKKIESKEEYNTRSKAESLSYIEKYPIQEENIIFSITFTEEL